MAKNNSIVILLLVLFTAQFLLYQPKVENNALTDLSQQAILPKEKGSNQQINTIIPPGPGGTEKVKSNVFNDGNMEATKANGEPLAFSSTGTGTNIVNNSYQDDVHTGNYGGYLSSEGTPQFSSSHYCSGSFLGVTERAYLDQDITMDLWYNAKSNPNYAQGAEQFIRMQFNTPLGDHYIYYYLSRVSGLPTNDSSSTIGYYDIRGPLNSWINVVRNLTQDFEQLFPTVSLDTSYPRYLYFWLTSTSNPSGPNVMLYDDVAFTNNTGFNYFWFNGDFELGTGDGWSNLVTGPGTLYTTTDDYTEGKSAMNMSTYCPSNNGMSYLNAQKALYNGWASVPNAWPSLQQEDLVFSFDWKYSNTPGIGNQQAYLRLQSTNGSFNHIIYFVLGLQNDNFESWYSNSSGSTYAYHYLKTEGFGVLDTWHHFTFDAFEIYNTFNISDVVPYYLSFYVENTDVEDNTNQLLVDDFQITTYPAGDASFEANIIETTADPFNFWYDPFDHIYANITSDAYDGNYAANITSYNGQGSVYISKITFLPVVDNLYTDFYWRLDRLTNISAGAMSYVRLEIDDSDYLYYVLGNNSYYNPTNSSGSCYYIIDDHNQIGSWNNLFRNINDDIIAHFGAGDHNITQIVLNSLASVSEEVSTIFDHIHFVRDIEEPSITNPAITPLAPEYDETVGVSVSVEDNIEVLEVVLYLKIDAGAWTAQPMILNGSSYVTTITDYDYGTTVSYYFEAIDINGLSAQLGSELSPYSYTVTDTVDPTLVYEAPPESQTLSGSVIFNFTDYYDFGSGIASFEILFNDSVILDDVEPPASFTLNTNTYPNDDYTLIFRLADNAGNTFEVTLEYTVYNPLTRWESFVAFATSPLGIFVWSASGAVIIGIFVAVMVVRAKRRKKLAA